MTNPVNPAKILSCRDEVLKIAGGGIPAPRTVELFVTTVCNHNCVGCHTRALRDSAPLHLPPAKLGELLEEWRGMGVQGLEISGVGEPLLYPHLEWLLTRAVELGFSAGLLTNGSMLHTADTELLLRSLRFIRVSYDSCFPDTYKKVHGADDLAKVEDNVKMLVRARKRLGLKTTIGLKTLLSKHNLKQIPDTAARARELGVDYIQYKALRNSPASPTHGMSAEAAKTIEAITNEFADASFAVIGGTGREKLANPCLLTPLHPVVDPGANLLVCPYYTHHPASHRIGSLKKRSFADLWGSAAHRRSISNIDPAICNIFDCPLIPLNNFALKAIVEDDMHLSFI